MSFGFGVSDFIAVGDLAPTAYRAYRDVPEQFAAISTEVGSLHLVPWTAREKNSYQPRRRLNWCR